MQARLVQDRPAAPPPRVSGWLDLGLLLPVAALLFLGSTMVFSASSIMALAEFGDSAFFVVRHVAWIGIGLATMVVLAHGDYHRWSKLAVPLYGLTLVLLLLVLIPGFGGQSYGAARWLTLGPLSFQPSEFAKLSVVLYLAAWIGRVGGDINKLTFGTIPFALIVALSAGLILKEDLGTTVVLCLTAASMAFIAGANVLHGLAGAIAACVLIANFALHGYRAERIETFFNPWADPSGLGWHTTQVLLALGSGGLAGLGLGASRQKHGYVPNAHTDSIYAIVGEELGFIGATVVLVLFLVIAWRGLTIAASARDPLGRSLAAGGTLLIIWQGLLNMAVTTHLVPNTGVPLPFLSYGGSSMVVSLAAVGLILSVGRGLDSAENGVRALVPSTVSRDPAPPQRWSPPPRRDSHRSSPRQQPKVARRRHTRGPIGRYL